MKKIILTITLFLTMILLLTFIMSLTVFSGCSDMWVSQDGYYYFDNKYGGLNSSELLIIGFTEEGRKQETLIFPFMLETKDIVGVRSYSNSKYNLRSDKLKSVYIPGFIDDISDYCELGKGLNNDRNDEVKIYFGCTYHRETETTKQSWDCFEPNCTIYAPKKYIDCQIQNDIREIKSKYVIANVIYYRNFKFKFGYKDEWEYAEDEFDKTFFVDDVDGTVVNVVPPDPMRIGFEFTGWYKEPECINKWDFEKDIVPAKEYDEEGNYIYKETKLFAGWQYMGENL